jgi:hypothetical protein
MRLIIVLALALVGCSDSNVGQACASDSECEPLVCNAPQGGATDPPFAGTCQHPSGVGGLCHRPAECEDGLICVLPAGASPATGGTCEKQQ